MFSEVSPPGAHDTIGTDLLRTLVDLVEDMAAVITPEGRVLFLNQAGRARLADLPVADELHLSSLLAPASVRILDEVALPAVRASGRWRGEVSLHALDGREDVVLTLQASAPVEGPPAHVLATLRDVTERRTAEEALRLHVTTDSLTHLPNRAILFDRLDHALARTSRSGGGVALLFVDLERFKQVNDQLGHDAGDDLLVQVAQRLLGAVRESDTVARLGGDEFVVLAEPIIRLEDARVVAERIVRCVSEPFSLREGTARVGARVGLAVSGRDGTARHLVRKADEALAAARSAAPGDRVVVAP